MCFTCHKNIKGEYVVSCIYMHKLKKFRGLLGLCLDAACWPLCRDTAGTPPSLLQISCVRISEAVSSPCNFAHSSGLWIRLLLLMQYWWYGGEWKGFT